MKKIDRQKEKIQEFSKRLIEAQRKITILDAIKWTDDIQQDFFANQFKKQPKVTEVYYEKMPLPYTVSEKKEEFRSIIRDVQNQFGNFSAISRLITERCQEYMQALNMLEVRGKAEFSEIAIELYGNPKDVFYPSGPRLAEMGTVLFDLLTKLDYELKNELDEKIYTAQQAREMLAENLGRYFQDPNRVKVIVSNELVADASAGADTIRLNDGRMFSPRDLRCLEVHEGWVHIGTTLNGSAQPYCHFLAKGSPSCSVLQEGLAVLIEVITMSSYPSRFRRITNRVVAMEKVLDGATFLDIFHYFLSCGTSEIESYSQTVRIFRGSTPEGGPFTKDLSYAKGFILAFTFILYAMAEHQFDAVDLLFVGKLSLEDIPLLIELRDIGLLEHPKYLPPQIADKAALSSLMSVFLYLNKFNFKDIQRNFRFLLPAR